jgi:nucleoid DNA-binding protein
MSGIWQISKTISARCPKCNASLDLGGFGPELFRRILVRLSEGDRVEVEQFGSFRSSTMKGRIYTNLKGSVVASKDKLVIRFRASPRAKAKVNEMWVESLNEGAKITPGESEIRGTKENIAVASSPKKPRRKVG